MKYFQVIKDLIPLLEREEEHMKQAGHLMAQSIMNGGIIQAFGSGHSYAGFHRNLLAELVACCQRKLSWKKPSGVTKPLKV